MDLRELRCCPLCGSTRIVLRRTGYDLGRMKGRGVADIQHVRCLACGEAFLNSDSLQALEAAQTTAGRRRARNAKATTTRRTG
jgi:hypothetical protein